MTVVVKTPPVVIGRSVPGNNDGQKAFISTAPVTQAGQAGIDNTLKLEAAAVANEARKAALIASGHTAESV